MLEDNIDYFAKVRNSLLFRGLRQWYGTEWKLQELEVSQVRLSGRSEVFPRKRIFVANLKKRENKDDALEVGLIHSRGVTGVMPSETVDSHLKGLALLCIGEGKHKPINESEDLCLQN